MKLFSSDRIALSRWVCFRILIAVALPLLAACHRPPEPTVVVAPPFRPSPPPLSPLPGWQESLGRGHPLLGKIWSAGTFVTAQQMMARATNASYVLLGEKHDNADHHRLQAWVLSSLLRTNRRPAVAFEMLDVDQQPAVDAYLASPNPSAEGFGLATQWTERGWPAWSSYQGIAQLALEHRLPFIAANARTADVRKLAWEGLDALPQSTTRRLGLDHVLPEALQQSLLDELQASHCGKLPTMTMASMALAQRARDAEMAEQLLTRPISQGAVLIAGAGHVRRDRGVPRELRARRANVSVVSIAWLEVRDSVSNPDDYAALAEKLPYDFVWFTTRHDNTNPCAKMDTKTVTDR